MVKEHYLTYVAAYDEAFPEGSTPDLDAIEAVDRKWYGDPQLEQQLLALEAQREGDRLIWQSDNEGLYLEVKNWSADGLECTLGVTLQSVVSRGYDLEGRLIETRENESKLILWRTRYDSESGCWRIHELVDFYNN